LHEETKGVYVNSKLHCLYKAAGLIALLALSLASAAAQVLTSEQAKKISPTSYYFAGQSAAVQARNTAALKSDAGKMVLAGLVDTSGYSTAIAEKYQGFLITETKLTFDGATLEVGQYGFGFKDGKFTVMNVAAADLLSVASKDDTEVKHPVPLKFEKDASGYRLYAGRKYVVIKTD
jgi:hypothetical protein